MYRFKYTPRAQKDAKKLNRSGLKDKVEKLLKIIQDNPFQTPPYYEKMTGYSNRYSRRINKQHRLVYTVYDDVIKINSMWSHYE